MVVTLVELLKVNVPPLPVEVIVEIGSVRLGVIVTVQVALALPSVKAVNFA